jgi:ParB family transcriptional regulator, chromosome partitioning protein
LVESFEAEGQRNFPAIVRRVEGDADHSFEVICAAWGHWTACSIQAHHQPDFKFPIEPREHGP